MNTSFPQDLNEENNKEKCKVMFDSNSINFNTYNFEDDQHLPIMKTIKLRSIHYDENKSTVMKNVAIREKLRALNSKQTVFGIKKFSYQLCSHQSNMQNRY